MDIKDKMSAQEYWQRNIEGFSGFYDRTSEESLQGPYIIRSLYKAFIFPLETKYMRQRFNMVSDYLRENLHQGMSMADIGCGSGIYTKQAAVKGARVYALDFVDKALELTRNGLTPEEIKLVQFSKMDITSRPIPKVDLAIAIGIFPYVDHLDPVFDNVLPFTERFLFNFLDKHSWLNFIRKKMPFLDVRGYQYFSLEHVRELLAARKFHITDVEKLATGFMVQSQRNDHE